MNELSINTSQNVNINFTTASLGERMLAFFIDMIVKVAYLYAVIYITSELGIYGNLNFDSWEQMVIIFILYFPVLFYSLILEALFNGQTIGKRMMKIKVIKIDGYQASFTDYLMRWILRLVEITIFMGSIALLTIIFNDRNQRLGDIVAGTAVISLKNKYQISHTFLQNMQESYQPVFQQVLRFSDNDIRIVRETYDKVLLNRDYDLQTRLVQKIEDTLHIKNPYQNPNEFIGIILKDYTYLTSQM